MANYAKNLVKTSMKSLEVDFFFSTTKHQKLACLELVTRNNIITKNILQGIVKGGWKHGGQYQSWSDNIKYRTRMTFSDLQAAPERIAENGGNHVPSAFISFQ